jgi:hypothetical protein
MSSLIQSIEHNDDLKLLGELVDASELRNASRTVASMLNSLRGLTQYEERLVRAKNQRGVLSFGLEQTYARAFNRFCEEDFRDGVESTRRMLDQLELSGLNLSLSRHFQDTLVKNRFPAGKVVDEVKNSHTLEEMQSILFDEFALDPHVSAAGWAILDNLEPEIDISIFETPADVPPDPGVGAGLSNSGGGFGGGGGGGMGHIRVQKGIGLLVQDMLHLLDTATTDIMQNVATTGIPTTSTTGVIGTNAAALLGPKTVGFILGALLVIAGTVNGIGWLILLGLLVVILCADSWGIKSGSPGASFVDP